MRGFIMTLILAAGCSDNSPAPGVQDMSGQDLAATADLAPVCVSNPLTSVELLNACTTADSVDKMPFYPSRAPNGQLPQLP